MSSVSNPATTASQAAARERPRGVQQFATEPMTLAFDVTVSAIQELGA
ncbi:MAG: hypothetical protein K0Q84_2920, partial [Arthrobacter sp.]|nr:hypothetical protein [Arthrobacter sp.]